MSTLCGIDDAGRGPVIGPLVLAGVLIEENQEEQLRKLKVRDSKMLSPMQRERLYGEILHFARKHEILFVQPEEIDVAVRENNLNWLEADKTIAIINALKPDTAYIDCPTNNIKAFKAYLEERIKVPCRLVVAHKADAKYPVVSAASILAKVTRDREIEKIQRIIKEPLGSGYPADPITITFLEKNYRKYPQLIRKTWDTYKRVAGKKGQRKLGEF